MTRYMLILRSTPAAEEAMANVDFEDVIAAMGRFNEELIKAGVLLAGEGLAGPEDGFVVDFDSETPVVTDGPYTEAKELFNGFWVVAVSSIEEAKQWAVKCPLGPGARLEVRRITETEEFPQDNEWVQKELRWKNGGVCLLGAAVGGFMARCRGTSTPESSICEHSMTVIGTRSSL